MVSVVDFIIFPHEFLRRAEDGQGEARRFRDAAESVLDRGIGDVTAVP